MGGVTPLPQTRNGRRADLHPLPNNSMATLRSSQSAPALAASANALAYMGPAAHGERGIVRLADQPHVNHALPFVDLGQAYLSTAPYQKIVRQRVGRPPRPSEEAAHTAATNVMAAVASKQRRPEGRALRAPASTAVLREARRARLSLIHI